MTASMRDLLGTMGRNSIAWLGRLGHAALFFVQLLCALPAGLRHPRLIIVQLYAIGNRSLTVVAASGLAVGCVLSLQMYYALVPFGAAESLGLVVNLSLVRELGAVMTGLLFAGRAGTSITAEIGLMKVGEQLIAMELMAVDPRIRLFAPRMIAGMLVLPLLAILFSAVGILGAYLVAVPLIGIDPGSFWAPMEARVDLVRDIGSGVLKAAAFGVICMTISLYQGIETQPTPEGVALSTTRTVVISSLWVLCMDFIMTAALFSTP